MTPPAEAEGTSGRNARRDRAAIIGAVRLSTVPLACAASFALDDGALQDVGFVVAALIAQTYAVAVWLLVRNGVGLRGRVVLTVDAVNVLALAITADPDKTVAGQLPLLLMFVIWALLLCPRELAVRGIGVAAVLTVADLVDDGTEDIPRLLLFVLVVAVVCATVARYVSARLESQAAMARRAEELEADMEDLQRRERSRIAQLLHDDSLQRLLAARQDLEDAADDPEALERVSEGLAQATRALRNLTLVVHDEALEQAGAEAAIERIVGDVATRCDLRSEVRVTSGLEPEVGQIVLPILRELLANVERHADARELRVELVRERDGIRLRVADDGRGFTRTELHEAARAGHLGHVGLRRRVADLQGALEIDSAPGHGTAVTVRLQAAAIAARGELERALRREREWNAALVAGFPDPFVVIDDGARIVDVSDRFVAITGWTRAELLSAEPGNFPHLPPERADEVGHQIRQRDLQDDHTVESQLYCRDGSRLDVIVSVRHVRDPRGGRGLRLVTFKDISERLEAERCLRREVDLSSAIRQAMQEPFLQTLDGVVVAVNEAFCRLTGFREDELVGATRPYFFIRTRTLDTAFEYAQRLDRDGAATTRLLALRSDGVEVEVQVQGITVRDADGTSIGRVQTAHAVEPPPPLGPRVPGIVPDR